MVCLHYMNLSQLVFVQKHVKQDMLFRNMSNRTSNAKTKIHHYLWFPLYILAITIEKAL